MLKDHLNSWLSWDRRSRISSFVALGRKIKRHYDAIKLLEFTILAMLKQNL